MVTNLGPSAGVVIVVVLFMRFATQHTKADRCHREKLAKECHAVQEKGLEMTSKALVVMTQTEKTLE